MKDRVNRELKYYCTDFDSIRSALRELGAKHVVTTRQKDFYYNLPTGSETKRLKLRTENDSIRVAYYNDSYKDGQRTVNYETWDVGGAPIQGILDAALGVKAIVEKQREKWQLGTIVFHLDDVKGVGHIFELEVEETSKDLSGEVDKYLQLFKPFLGDQIEGSNEDLVPHIS